MKLIQLILAPLLALMMLTYLSRFRSRLFDRLIVLSCGTLGIIMVLMPDWANALAHLVGVGRGADLTMYFGLVGLAFLGLRLYAKLRLLETQLVRMAQADAIEHAQRPVE
jgi:small membrane protein